MIKYEKIGEIVYPVMYHENGIITVDYPELEPKRKINKKMSEKFLSDIQAFIKKYDIKLGKLG